MLYEEKGISDDSTLIQLKELCDKFKGLEFEIEKAEDLLKNKKKDLQAISRESIPSLLNANGLSELKLSTGEKIQISDKVIANITNKNFNEAFQNMVNSELDLENVLEAERKITGLFKNKLTIENPTQTIQELLLSEGIAYTLDKSIHSQTLNKYCRNRLEQGLSIPDGISVFEYQETKIKK